MRENFIIVFTTLYIHPFLICSYPSAYRSKFNTIASKMSRVRCSICSIYFWNYSILCFYYMTKFQNIRVIFGSKKWGFKSIYFHRKISGKKSSQFFFYGGSIFWGVSNIYFYATSIWNFIIPIIWAFYSSKIVGCFPSIFCRILKCVTKYM